MIELLVKYARSQGIPLPPGFAPKTVKWALSFDVAGVYLGVLPLGDTSIKKNPGQTFPCCPDLTQGELVSLKGGAHFLVETAQVVALHGDEKPDLSNPKHRFFIQTLCQSAKVISGLDGVAKTLEDAAVLQTIAKDLAELKAKPTDKVTIRMNGIYPVETDVWHAWWQHFRDVLRDKTRDKSSASGGAKMVSYASGELDTPALTHPKIIGLSDVGGIGMGSPLIGFDKDAFPSYGLPQSANAAMSEETASTYRAALNHLIANHGQRLAGAKVVHWFSHKVEPENDPFAWIEEPQAQTELDALHRAKAILNAIRDGTKADLADNHYYALTLSGAGGRVMVRDWMEGQFAELVDCVNHWFSDLAIAHRDGRGLAPNPKFLAVMGATNRDLGDVSAPAIARMWRVAAHGYSIPSQFMAMALARARVDIIQGNPANHARMGLLRAYHVRQGDKYMEPYLNEQHPEAAYHCGRLMSVLADLQSAALPNVDAGVVQRYYAAASSTPALVLGRLTRTSQYHLNKIGGGLAHIYEDRIATIWGSLRDNVPATLSLEQQSLFALGYYQQMAKDRADRAERAAQKKQQTIHDEKENSNA